METVPCVGLPAVRRSLQEAAASYAHHQASAPAARSTGRSVETLVVIIAAIVLAAALAGVLARACGGRHVAPSADRDVEGWVERRCRTCLDGGLPAPPGTSSNTTAAK
ncbi:uncharacterized protein LOC124700822 [Lolium rigidum]|uniref:uncharacterized protein LOC124700822 n=1 Tax=Lolium rigidum TaxID=89674 RepID=UPI001F5CE856|nr:uncharacterized protein LOC124700822 [Lolium rigidum]